jgi:hypothetical protein
VKIAPPHNNPSAATYSAAGPTAALRQTGTASFMELLAPRDAATDRTPQSVEDQTREAARSLVAITLIEPLLAEARNDPFRSDLFHGGLAEDSFGQQLDSIIAQRVTSRSNLPIVESVYNHITQRGSRVNTHG